MSKHTKQYYTQPFVFPAIGLGTAMTVILCWSIWSGYMPGRQTAALMFSAAIATLSCRLLESLLHFDSKKVTLGILALNFILTTVLIFVILLMVI